jgi:hypothetical protein
VRNIGRFISGSEVEAGDWLLRKHFRLPPTISRTWLHFALRRRPIMSQVNR